MDERAQAGKFRTVSRLLQENFWWWFPLLLGIFARAEYLREFSSSPLFSFALGPDVAEYDQRAREILGGVLFPLRPEEHAPLYSFFLAGVYRFFPWAPVPAARAVTLLLSLPASFVLALELYRNGWKRSLCGWFLAGMVLLPNLIYFQAELVPASLLFPEMTLALAFLLRACRTGGCVPAFASGLFCGLGVLTHGLAFCFLAAVSTAACCRKKWKHLVCVLCGALLLLLPVIAAKSVRYVQLTGVQSNAAFLVWLGNNPQAKGYCNLAPGQKLRQVRRETAQEAKARQVSPPRVWLEKAGAFWKEHPWKGLVLLARKAVYFFHPNELPSGADPGILICQTDYVFWGRSVVPAVFLLAFIGTWEVVRRRREYLPALLLVGAFWIGTLLTFSCGNFRMGAWPGILVLAALGMDAMNWKRWWSLPALAVLLSLPFSFPFMAAGKIEAAALWGEAAFRRGNFDLAEDLLAYSARKLNDPPRTSCLLGRIAEERGDLLTAEKWYRDAAEAEPLHPEAWMRLGMLYGEKTRYHEAEACFERAMMLGNDPSQAACNYGLLQIRREKYEDAKRLESTAVYYAPADPKNWNALGIAEFCLGNHEKASLAFRRAQALEPANPGYAANAEAARRFCKERE